MKQTDCDASKNQTVKQTASTLMTTFMAQ